MKKVVLVTGAAGNLGQEVCKRFIRGDWKVYGTSSSDLPEKDGVEFVKVDLANADDVRSVLGPIASQIHAVVHCAGAFKMVGFADFTDADYDSLMDSNLRSAFLVVRELLPPMKKNNFGRFIFIGSNTTLRGSGAGLGIYAASKAGINMLVQSLANEVLDFDITVNALLPSTLDTPQNRKNMPRSDFTKWVDLKTLSELAFNLTESSYKSVHSALIPVSGRV